MGQLILLLQPTTDSKVTAAWGGPYRVIEKRDHNNYAIDCDGRRLIQHINLLRPYLQRAETVGAVITEDSSDETELPVTIESEQGEGGGPSDAQIGSQLTDEQRKQLTDLLQSYDDVLTARTGRTSLVEHKITVTNEAPMRQPPFKIPEHLRPQIEDEIRRLIKLGILVESQSPHCSNMVIVRKKNGSIRLCCDMRLVNGRTVPIGYKGADMQYVLNRATKSRYKSLIDLRGYFHQLPVHAESQK